MPNITEQDILELNDTQALTAARSLIVLLDIKLQQTAGTSRPPNAQTAEPQQLIAQADPQTQKLAEALQQADQKEAAACARTLMLACLQMDFDEEVAAAYESAKAHVLDMGLLSGPVLVAALAVVVAWIPKETKVVVSEQTTTNPDGTVTTKKEKNVEISRVGADALKALKDWWIHAFG